MAKPKSLPYDAPEAEGAYSVSLHSVAGGSDKVYKLAIEQSGSGWLVNFANGPRGGTLKANTKTPSPVDYPTARKLLNGVLYSKVGDGYVPTSGSRFSEGMTAEAIAVIAKESSGWLPQLLTAIEDPEDELDFYTFRDNWACEEKHNGERRFVIVDENGIRGGNRTGQTVALPAPIANAAGELGHTFVLDGEQVGDRFHAFDILELDGESLVDRPLRERRQLLENLLSDHENDPNLRVTRQFTDQLSKLDLIDDVRRRRGEGVVFKELSSRYVIGRPTTEGDWVKLKFWKALSAIVDAVNAKRSVVMTVVDDVSGAPVRIGNVTIPVNQDMPQPGDIIEVRYLYAYDGGSLYQPTFEGIRTDIRPEECLASQRQFIASPDEMEADDDMSPASPGMRP